jgi:hypothetical protein
MRARFATLAVVVVLGVFAGIAPGVRRHFIHDVITWDAPATEPVELPAGTGPGVAAAARVRVVLIDGLGTEAAHRLATWSALCKTGLRLQVDVGFPTVSLPVGVSPR